MFEKEAEEYAENREVCGLLDAISENLQNYDYGTVAHYNIDPLVEECFQDGADFGYNKAKEEDKALIEKMKCCEICKHKNLNFSFSPFCQKIGEEIKNPLRCKCSEWELKED